MSYDVSTGKDLINQTEIKIIIDHREDVAWQVNE